jgi:hypothetical protein
MMRQVMVRPTAGSGPSLHVDPLGTEDESSGTELHLGSQDLIRFAGYASAHGFVVSGFDVADAFMTALDEGERVEVSDAMVELLDSFGFEELISAMRDDFDGLYVIGVRLISKDNGMRTDVRRRGFVNTSVVQEAERLLNSAWRELHLR